MAWGHIANGNLMERAHTNPILDTRMYQVEFRWVKSSEVTANVVGESMYT